MITFSLLATDMSVPPAQADPTSSPAPSAPSTSGSDWVEPTGEGLVRPDVVSARVTARATGKRVEVLSERSETSRTWATPDGGFSSEMAGGPVRFQDKSATRTDGWRDIDLTLQKNPDGTVSPAAAPNKVVLAGSGDEAATMITTVDDGNKVVLGAGIDGTLPQPTLDKDTATYADVLPGVDVKVEVRPTGFETFWVAKDRAGLDRLLAAQPGGDQGLSTDLTTSKDLSAVPHSDGSVSFVDSDVKVVSKIAPPTVWDAASTDQTSADPTQVEPADLALSDGDGETVPVKQDASGDLGLAVIPDQDWLTSPDRVFPITIDPTYVSATAKPIYDAFVEETWTGDHSSDDILKFGNNGATPGLVARTYLAFSTTAVQGKTITSGSLDLYGTYTRTCAARAWSSWNAGVGTTATRWTNQPWVSDKYGTSTQAKGYQSGCPNGTVKMDMTKQLQMWSNSDTNPRGILLRADDETDTSYWKEFASSETSHPPVLRWTYSRNPGSTATPSVSPVTSYKPAGSSTSYYYTSDPTPNVSAVMAADPDGDVMRSRVFAFDNATTVSEADKIRSCAGSVWHAAGETSMCWFGTDLPDNTTVWIRARSQDSTGLNGPMSAARQIRIASTVPNKPAIACPGLSNNTWTTTGPSSAVTCTITATGSGFSAPSSIKWSVDGKSYASSPIPQSTSASTAKTTVSLPATTGGHKITAYAINPAGLTSAQAVFQSGWGTASLTTPRTTQQVTTTDTVIVTAAGPAKGGSALPGAKVQWRVAGASGTTGWIDAPTGTNFTVIDDAGGTKATATFDTGLLVGESDASSIKVGERTATLLDLRVCLTYDSGTQCTGSARIQRVPHAFDDGFPEADAGPGTVGLWTGELTMSESDAELATPDGALSVSRTHSSFAGPAVSPQNRIFGPGWTASFDDEDGGSGGAEIWDNSYIDGSISVVGADGEMLTYLSPGATPGIRRKTAALPIGPWVPADDDTTRSGSTMVISGGGTSTVLELKSLDGVTTKFQVTAAPVASDAAIFRTVEVREQATSGKTTYTYDSESRITAIVARLPDGVTSCVPGTPSAGCRVLKFSYADMTTATSTAPGDYKDQLAKITAQVNTDSDRTLATYKYNVSGQLVSATDARTSLTASYTWTGSGAAQRLASYTPPGQAKYTFVYANNRLFKVTRPNPATAGGGTAQVGAYVYNVPLQGTIAGLPDMAAEVNRWNQSAAPTWAAAVFGQDKPITAAPTAGSNDWQYASLQFTDEDGFTVNTAGYGAGEWQITAQDYDDYGNVIHSWDERAIAGIRHGTLPGGESATDVATITRYNENDILDANDNVVMPAGELVLDTYAPVLDAAGDTGSTMQLARRHTHIDYDQGAPNNGVNPDTGVAYGLQTKSTVTAEDTVGNVFETMSITLMGYDPIESGDSSGWQLGQPTSTTIDMDLSGTVTSGDIITKSRYDARNNVIETRKPKSTGADAGSRVISYYSGGTSSIPACSNKAKWAGMVCQIKPASQPAGQELPVTTNTYNWDLQIATQTDSAGSATGMSTTQFDDHDRAIAIETTVSGIANSTPIPTATTIYDPATGLPTGTTSTAGTTTSGYDNWGRLTSYSTTTNGNTDSSQTTYDKNGNIASVSDDTGSTDYTYDGDDANGAAEHRGLPTSATVNQPNGGAYTSKAAYDAAGQLALEQLPGQIIRRQSFDLTGNLTELTYNGQGTDDTGSQVADQPWMSWHSVYDVLGRVIAEKTPSGVGGAALSEEVYDHQYKYDRASRLTQAQERSTNDGTPAACTTRTYGFDKNGNRINQGLYMADTSGNCQTSSGNTTTRTYDAADRITNGAKPSDTYSYDALGRQTQIPASDTTQKTGPITLRYYDNDTIKSISQDAGDSTDTSEYSLDGVGRRYIETTTTAGATDTLTRHYSDHSDNPTWTTSVRAGRPVTTRFGRLVDGNPSVIITTDETGTTAGVALTTPRGDILGTADLPAPSAASTGIDSYSTYDEYGNAATTDRALPNPGGVKGSGYGWLGSAQRSDTGSGLMLMGLRLYNPQTGLFTSPDSLSGANSTDYVYPQDPINTNDISGACGPACVIAGAIVAAIDVAYALAMAATVVILLYATYYVIKTIRSRAITGTWHIAIPKPTRFRARKTYWGYEIRYRYLSRWHTWKFGITSARNKDSRPREQLSSCKTLMRGRCDYKWRKKGMEGFFRARKWEAGSILGYWIVYGHCPPGQWKSCR